MGDLAEIISDPILEEAVRKGDYSVSGLLRRKLPLQLQIIAVNLYNEELGRRGHLLQHNRGSPALPIVS